MSKLIDYFQSEIGIVKLGGDGVRIELYRCSLTPRQARGLAQQLLLLADNAEHPGRTVKFSSIPAGDRFRYRGREFTKCQGGYASTDNYIVSAFEPDAEVEPL